MKNEKARISTQKQKTKRLQMMLSGAFAILFTGYPHVWSIYQPYVMESAGWTQGEASMCFYLSLAGFVVGNIIGGHIQDAGKERLVIFAGGGIFAAGILLSAFLIIPSPIPIYITYGGMQGIGQGMIYTTIIATAQKWFPDRLGFGSGVVVTANGTCGFFLAPASKALLEMGGPKLALLVIGGVITVSWILCCIFFSVPEWGDGQGADGSETVYAGRQYAPSEMIRTKSFCFLLATMLFGLISYFIVSPVSQTYQTGLGIPSAVAVSAVMFGSVMNAGSRLVLPALSDKIGRIPCIRCVLAGMAAAMLVLSVSHSYPVTAAIVLAYGCYGGIMGSFPSFTSSVFGLRHAGENYGYVMVGIVIATFGAPAVTGIITGAGFGMQTVFAAGVVFALAASVCLFLLERELRKQ